MKKFSGRGFVVVAINIHPEEDHMVKPFFEGNGYDFLPLKATSEWAEKVYQVVGTPENFLLDREGRIVFNPRIYNTETARTLELEIEALIGSR